MAYGILNDPRYKGGNQTGAIKAIEGIKAGLSEHPGVKRAIYKTQNEPDNLKEEMEEGLDANQKRAGQLGPVGGPAKVGDLVGAESKHADDEMSIHQMSDEDLADYLNVDVKDVKADRDHAEEVANDKSHDHAPDNMLEDILRLSGRTEYTGYGSTGKGAGTPYKG